MADTENEPTNESLQAIIDELRRDKAALTSEFADSASDTITEENGKKRIIELAPDALATLRYLVKNADSESVKATCAKYILDITIGKKKIEGDIDQGIENLIESLRPKAT